MNSFTIALLQTKWLGSREAMKAQYQTMAAEAVAKGANFLCLPEFSLSPYFAGTTDPSGYEWVEPLAGGESDAFFAQLAKAHHVTVVGSLFEQHPDGRYFDTATIHIPSGEQAYFMRKLHIPSGEGYHETDFFEGSTEYPIANLAQGNVAVPTCYDQWFPEVARICAIKGAELIAYPTAIGSEPTAPEVDTQNAWQTVMRGHAIANGVFIAATNRTGVENDVTFYGSSFVCAPNGEILAQAGRNTTEVVIAQIDAAAQEQWRVLFPLLHQRKPQIYQPILDRYDHDLPERWQDHHAFNDS